MPKKTSKEKVFKEYFPGLLLNKFKEVENN